MCSEASTSPPCARGAQTGVRAGRAVGTGGLPSPPPAAGLGTWRHRCTGPLTGSNQRQPCCRTPTPCRIEGCQHRRLLEEGKRKGCALGTARHRERCRALPSQPSGFLWGLLGRGCWGEPGRAPVTPLQGMKEARKWPEQQPSCGWLCPWQHPHGLGPTPQGGDGHPYSPHEGQRCPRCHCPAAAKGASSGTAPPCAAPPHAPVSAPKRGTATLSGAGPAVPETGAPAEGAAEAPPGQRSRVPSPSNWADPCPCFPSLSPGEGAEPCPPPSPSSIYKNTLLWEGGAQELSVQ